MCARHTCVIAGVCMGARARVYAHDFVCARARLCVCACGEREREREGEGEMERSVNIHQNSVLKVALS